jgi:mannose-6-phosphate isomerase-like protein (cupin superfamily)
MGAFVAEIEELGLRSQYSRQVLFTGEHAQFAVIYLQPGEEIGEQTHADVDQFFRVERGEARFVLDGEGEHLVRAGAGIAVPARTRHNVINVSRTEPLRLYTLYAPPDHPDQMVQPRKVDGKVAEAVHA